MSTAKKKQSPDEPKTKKRRPTWPPVREYVIVDARGNGGERRFFPAAKTAEARRYAAKSGADARQSWLVDTRIAGKGPKRFFDTKKEADAYADTQRTRRTNEGTAAVHDAELRAFGWTVQQAINFALAHLRRKNRSVPLREAVKAYLDFKRQSVGDRRHLDMSQRLGRVMATLGEETPLAHITADHLNAMLEAIPHPATRNDYRKEVVALWRYAAAAPREWTALKLDKFALPRARELDKGRVILTVDDARRLMLASTDPEIRALNALVLFGGLRREEVEILDWAAVDFRTGHISVTAEISKVRAERFAPMPDNLRAWLLPLAKRSGQIVTRHLMHPLRRTWKAAGLYPWPQDAHRHSFISYRRKLVGDWQTALEAGTSESIIKKHYQRPVLQEDAEAFFAITPEPSKIVRLPATSGR